MKNKNNINYKNLVEIASFSPKSVEFPHPWIGHIPFMCWFLKELKPKIFVELGTHSGNSYFSACQLVKESKLKTKCFAVDTWEGDEQSGYYGNQVFEQVSSNNIANYQEFSKLMRMKFDDAVLHFKDQSIDLLHIDGLHTYEAVHHDFTTLFKFAVFIRCGIILTYGLRNPYFLCKCWVMGHRFHKAMLLG
jgi:hypothetical protein